MLYCCIQFCYELTQLAEFTPQIGFACTIKILKRWPANGGAAKDAWRYLIEWVYLLRRNTSNYSMFRGPSHSTPTPFVSTHVSGFHKKGVFH